MITTFIAAFFTMFIIFEICIISVYSSFPHYNSKKVDEWLDTNQKYLFYFAGIYTNYITAGYISIRGHSLLVSYVVRIDYDKYVLVLRWSPLHWRIKNIIGKIK